MRYDFLNTIISIFNPKYKKEVDYLDGILSEYKRKYPLYEEFRGTLHKVIEAFLKDSKYKYQITSRTKSIERLEEKLIRKKEEGKYYHSLDEIEDLVGIRVIFYTERDRKAFLTEIKKEISGEMKAEERVKTNGYQASHLVVTLGSKRLQLSEYQHFNNLKSEVQITSILHHAWAEIEHDLIYKDVHGFKKIDPHKFKVIQSKMEEIMEKYIKKAAKELEEIIYENMN